MTVHMGGHRYTKAIVIASIVVVSGLITIFYVFSGGSMAFSNVLSANSMPREPIAVYEHCVENPIQGSRERLDVDCYARQIPQRAVFNIQDGGTGGLVKSFNFNRPSQLVGTSYVDIELTVYQYGQNDFELGLMDQVGEKQYHTTLWELST